MFTRIFFTTKPQKPALRSRELWQPSLSRLGEAGGKLWRAIMRQYVP
jgi:hypothetical protein